LVLNILVTVIYGVGKMGREIYEAPKGIKLFIQILLRFNPSFGVFLYSIMTCKGNKFKILLFMLLIIMSLLKGSLGVFPSIGIFMIIQYYDKIKLFIRKYLLIMVVIIVMFPTIIRSLYTFREYLRSGKRTESYSKIEAGKIVTGVLIGRLSSFSNSAIIMERKTTMIRLMQDFSSMQYIKESLTSIYGGFIDNKKIAYTNIMLESQGVHTRISSFMLGTQGVLLLSLYQSMAMFLINLGVKLSFIILTFNLTMMINNEKIKVLLFSSFCSTVLSGVGREYMSCLITVIIYLGLFLFVNMIEKNC
jgi:hypothetical protein